MARTAFSRRFGEEPEVVWTALESSLGGIEHLEVTELDAANRRAEFSTSMWLSKALTSWGEKFTATVEKTPEGTELRVRGEPIRPGLHNATTQLGENIHVRKLERELDKAMAQALRS